MSLLSSLAFRTVSKWPHSFLTSPRLQSAVSSSYLSTSASVSKPDSESPKRPTKAARSKDEGRKSKAVVKIKKTVGPEHMVFQPTQLRPPLAAFLKQDKMPRSNALQEVWSYIREKELQDPQERSLVRLDEPLCAALEVPTATVVKHVEIMGLISNQMVKDALKVKYRVTIPVVREVCLKLVEEEVLGDAEECYERIKDLLSPEADTASAATHSTTNPAVTPL